MITLITGGPGAGKTAFCVSELEKFLEKYPERQVFVMGITDLKLPVEQTPRLKDWTRIETCEEDDELTKYVFAFPPNSLVVVDEAQNIFRQRSPGSRVPAHVQALETHRHQGIDFWFLTQKPNLIDSNVRNLVGKHQHIRVKWNGREMYEWGECKNPGSTTDLSMGIKRNYSLPKKSFGLYKSAEVHTKQHRRIPIAVFVLGIAVVAFGVLAYSVSDVFAFFGTKSDGESPSAIHQESERPADVQAALARPSDARARPERQRYSLVSSTVVKVGGKLIISEWVLYSSKGYQVDADFCDQKPGTLSCYVNGQSVTVKGRHEQKQVPAKRFESRSSL